MDTIDKLICSTLESQGNLTTKELAEVIKLSVSATFERVKKLERNNTIQGYKAIISPVQMDRSIEVWILINLDGHKKEVIESFERKVIKLDEVYEARHLSGNYDYSLRVMVKDMEHYTRFLNDSLSRVPGIQNINSSFVLKELKG